MLMRHTYVPLGACQTALMPLLWRPAAAATTLPQRGMPAQALLKETSSFDTVSWLLLQPAAPPTHPPTHLIQGAAGY